MIRKNDKNGSLGAAIFLSVKNKGMGVEMEAEKRVYIEEVRVEGLHGQFDVEMEFNPRLNVIYGKNGRGKTTMLHLLANLLELDFERFKYLKFRRIYVKTSAGCVVEIERDGPVSPLLISVNGNQIALGEDGLSPIEASSLRNALGGRATYLPAFRSVLERTRVDMAAYYRGVADRRSVDFEPLHRREFAALKEVLPESAMVRALQEEAANSAEKTLLCRQWFGSFVPVIRYPSIGEVEDALTEEWRRAQLEITAREQRMFEETFVSVFRIGAGLEWPSPAESNERILQEISDILETQDSWSGAGGSREINYTLLESARQLSSSAQPSGGMNTALLEVYRKALNEREEARRLAFKKTLEFEGSVNKFLDKKRLVIGRSVSSVPVKRNYVSVITEAESMYGLSALSSGERQIVTMLYSASRTKFTSGLFLVDEPELSLHIDWQRIILRELQRQAPDRQIIVCTHSPEVGADHMYEVHDFEPSATRDRQGSLFVEDEDV